MSVVTTVAIVVPLLHRLVAAASRWPLRMTGYASVPQLGSRRRFETN